MLLLRDGDADVGSLIANGCRAAGWQVLESPRLRTAELCRNPPEVDTLLAYGPHNGSMMPVAALLDAYPRDRRPRFVWWLCENAPDPGKPSACLRAASALRWTLDRALSYEDGEVAGSRVRRWLTSGHRHRILAELQFFKRQGLLDRLVVTSAARTRALTRLGFRCVTVPLGYDATLLGEDRCQPRDRDVLFLGNPGSPRRRALLGAIADALAAHGVLLEIVDGDPGFLDGDARTDLLNRCRVFLNLLRAPDEFTGHRLLLGMANKALVVSERLVDPTPFVPDQHFVHASQDALVDTILRGLADGAMRKRVVEHAYQFITTDLAMPRMCERCLA